MSSSNDAVYYEDIHPVKPPPGSAPAATAKSQDKSAATATGTKRQRTLNDMFGGGSTKSVNADTASKEPDAKRSRLNVKGTAASQTPTTNMVHATGSASLNSIPFNASAYISGLTEDQKRLLALEVSTMGKSWLKVLKDEIKKPYFMKLKEFLWSEGVRGPEEDYSRLKIYPSPKNIYAWSNYTPLGKVKVVIIGQDPYHGAGQAHGLCFSVPKGVSVPPSLRNIYAEIKAEYPSFVPPKHGNLLAWASAGVLLLNTALTVRAGQAGSHAQRGWETFTSRVVAAVDTYGGAALGEAKKTGRGQGVVFLCWGKWAAERVAKMDRKKHLILESAHPSPMSAHRGFLGNGHFVAANKWLCERYGPEGEVDWCSVANGTPPTMSTKQLRSTVDDEKTDMAPAASGSATPDVAPGASAAPADITEKDEAQMDAVAVAGDSVGLINSEEETSPGSAEAAVVD